MNFNENIFEIEKKEGKIILTGVKDESLTEAVIPEGVTSIGHMAFCHCEKLKNVNIPDSVTTIGQDAFSDCDSLTNITIGNNVTIIGNSAFNRCHSLSNITIPDGVKIIGNWTFQYCRNLTNITIPEGVTTIGQEAFYNCKSITSIHIPDSVTYIGEDAFSGCTCLTGITVSSGNPVYHSVGNCLIETETGKLIVGCENSIIPNDGSITAIGCSAFRDCTGLTSVNIPDSVTTIGNWAFDGCTGLTSITIPQNVIAIGSCAFADCTGLTEINWSAKTVADFYSSPFLKAGAARDGITITFGNNVEKIPANVCNAFESSYRPDNSPKIKNVIIGNGVTDIGENAFYNCYDLEQVQFGHNLKTIANGAFGNCKKLSNVELSDSVEVQSFAFEGTPFKSQDLGLTFKEFLIGATFKEIQDDYLIIEKNGGEYKFDVTLDWSGYDEDDEDFNNDFEPAKVLECKEIGIRYWL